MDSIKNAFHIEQIKTPQQFKAIINRLMPKDKSDLKRIESIVKKYENKIPSNKELKKKSIMVARKIDPKNGEKTYLSILLNIQKMIFKYEPFPSITILPLSLLLAFYVYLKVKKRNIPVSKVYAEMEKKLSKLVSKSRPINSYKILDLLFKGMVLSATFLAGSLYGEGGIGAAVGGLGLVMFIALLISYWSSLFAAARKATKEAK